MSRWMPIESAPKTSQSIMVWCDGNKCAYIVSWRDWGANPGWNIFGSFESAPQTPPTHWMPIPDEPHNLALDFVPADDEDSDEDTDPNRTDLYTENGGEAGA